MYSYAIRMSLYVLVCHLYVTRMYSCVIRMSLVCTRMLLVCYVTRMYSHVIRMSLVCGFTMNHVKQRDDDIYNNLLWSLCDSDAAKRK